MLLSSHSVLYLPARENIHTGRRSISSRKVPLNQYVLDDEFEQLMNSTQLEALASTKSQNSSIWTDTSICIHLCRILINWSCQLCHLDIRGDRKLDSDGLVGTSDRQSPSTRRRWLLWTSLVKMIYLYTSLKCIALAYHQYEYDFGCEAYKRLTHKTCRQDHYLSTVRSNLTASTLDQFVKLSNWTEPEYRIIKRIVKVKDKFVWLGAPFLQLEFLNEYMLLLVTSVTFLIYLQPKFYFNYFQPFDFSTARSIVDFPLELKLCNKIIRNEVNKYIESSRNYTQISLANMLKTVDRRRESQVYYSQQYCAIVDMTADSDSQPEIGSRRHRRVSSQWLPDNLAGLNEHLSRITTLQRMALDGSFMPCNRSRPWLDQVAHYNGLLSALFQFYCLLAMILMLILIPKMRAIEVQDSFVDVLTLIEHVVLALILFWFGTFYGGIILMTVVDQTHLVRNLRADIDRFIVDSWLKFQLCQLILESFGPDGRDDVVEAENETQTTAIAFVEENFRQMNEEFIKLVMQYKIFVAQLIPNTRSYGFIALTATALFAVMPLVGRLHTPYIARDAHVYVDIANLSCSLTADVWMLIPISYLFSSSSKLYKSLSSLLAHAVAVSETASSRRSLARLRSASSSSPARPGRRMAPVYDSHAVWMLRKELDQPESLVKKFVVVVLGVPVSYENLLRLHFWMALITQSTGFYEHKGDRADAFDGFLADPFAIFLRD